VITPTKTEKTSVYPQSMKKTCFGHVLKGVKNGQKAFWSCPKKGEKRAKYVLVMSKKGKKRAKHVLVIF
jgi:hypothetical protein